MINWHFLVFLLFVNVNASHPPGYLETRLHVQNTTYLDVALSAADWIVSQAIKTPNGVYWEDSLIGQGGISYNRSLDLYSGVSGTVLFLLEAYKVSPSSKKYLTTAMSGGDYILYQLPNALSPGGENHDTSLYHGGAAGLGYILDLLYLQTNERRYFAGAERVMDFIAGEAKQKKVGIQLNTVNGIRWGAAGTGFYLIDRFQNTGNASCLTLAKAGAENMISLGVPEHGGLKWYWGENRPTLNYPNYAAGAAGMGYYFLTLYDLDGQKNKTLLTAALQAAKYLLAIANRDNDGCEIVVTTQQSHFYYLGECNGPSGTGRFWSRLYQVTKDKKWLTIAKAAAKTIQDHCILNDMDEVKFNFVYHDDGTKDPWWNNVGQCDGTAAGAELFLFLYQLSNDQQYWDWADRLASDIIKRGTKTAEGMKWVTTEWRTNPTTTTGPQVGYMQGNAGLGSLFLIMDAVLNKKKPVDVRLNLPDSAYNFGFAP